MSQRYRYSKLISKGKNKNYAGNQIVLPADDNGEGAEITSGLLRIYQRGVFLW